MGPRPPPRGPSRRRRRLPHPPRPPYPRLLHPPRPPPASASSPTASSAASATATPTPPSSPETGRMPAASRGTENGKQRTERPCGGDRRGPVTLPRFYLCILRVVARRPIGPICPIGPTVSPGMARSGTSTGRAGGAGRTSPCRGVGQRPTPFPLFSSPPLPFAPRNPIRPAASRSAASPEGTKKAPRGRGLFGGRGAGPHLAALAASRALALRASSLALAASKVVWKAWASFWSLACQASTFSSRPASSASTAL